MQSRTARDFIDLAYRVGELAHSRPDKADIYAKAALDLSEAAMNALKVEASLRAWQPSQETGENP